MQVRLRVMLVATLGTLWAVLLLVGGSLLALADHDRWRAAGDALTVGGLTAAAAGAFVFQVVVADRLFPQVQRRLADATEATLAVLLLLGVVVTSALLVGGLA